jgi:outer membrane protein assembly factor BamB
MTERNTGAPGQRPRWWPPIAILVLFGVGLVWNAGRDHASRQDATMGWMYLLACAIVALLLWLLFFSRLRWRVRLGAFFCLWAALFLVNVLLRFEGLDGDFVPVVRWRFASVAADRAHAGDPGAMVAPLSSFPQFQGPDRDGTLHGFRLERDWTARPPRELWRRPVGKGWSGFAVVGDAAYTQEQRAGGEAVVCYELANGAERWAHVDAGTYASVIAGDGPRATPTVAGERVFTLGSTGLLNALDRETGEVLWTRDVLAENGAEVPTWGLSGSPLVTGGKVVVGVGGGEGRSLAAYDAETGAPVWTGGDDVIAYSSPREATLAGRPQILIVNYTTIAGHDPESGAVLWEAPWQDRHPNVAQPVLVSDTDLVVTTGYGWGAARLRLEVDGAGLRATELWRSRALKSKFANVVPLDGRLYGLDDGTLTCVDAATGKRLWKDGRYGHGQLLLVEDLLLVGAESGDVVLVEPSPDALRELARFPALVGKTWNPPALAAPYLLVRNDAEAVCLELPLTDERP